MPRKSKIKFSSRASSESSDAVPRDLLELTRRPKFPFHFAVTLALKNAGKEYVTSHEIRVFIHKYIPGWKYKVPSPFTMTKHYNKKIVAKEGLYFTLKQNRMKEFDKHLQKMMEGCTDRNSWEYGLADPDDWEPMINGKLHTVGVFNKTQVTPITSPVDIPNKRIKIALFGADEERESDHDEQADIKDVQKHPDTDKLELRWIFDMAVLHNGNRLASSNIFEFVTKNFPEYRRCHQWKQELLGMVVCDRMKAVKEVLDWQTHYIVTDTEIKQFKTFISRFMDKHPDGPVGLDPNVKWDDLVPFELISCINMYLGSKRTVSCGTKLVKKEQNAREKEKTPCNDEEDDLDETKSKKRSIGSRRASSKKPRSPSNKRVKKVEKTPRTDWTYSATRTFATSSVERAARVTRRCIRKSDAPVYDRPNPLLPRPTTVTHVENSAFVPLSTGEQDSEIGSPFDGVFVPPEFIALSSQFIKSLPQESGEVNEGQEFPSDLEGIEPAHLLGNSTLNNNMFSDEPSMREVPQEKEKTGEQNVEEEEENIQEENIQEENNNEMNEKQSEANDSSNCGELSLTATPTATKPSATLTSVDSKSNILLNMALAKVKLDVKQEYVDNSKHKEETSDGEWGSESSIECLGFRSMQDSSAEDNEAAPHVIDYDSDVVELDGI